LLTIIFLGAYAEQSSNKKATAYRAAIFAGMASLIVINFIVLLGSVDISIFGIWQLPHFE